MSFPNIKLTIIYKLSLEHSRKVGSVSRAIIVLLLLISSFYSNIRTGSHVHKVLY